MKLKNVCVYCGSSPGKSPVYALAARAMGYELATRQMTLVYGGGRAGLMGEVARATLEKGGRVIGVIPAALREQELAFHELAELHVVNSMHERKALMAELSDGFVAMPGGYGTLEEIFEMLTWLQLGLHCKPCGFVNTAGFFDRLFDFLDKTVELDFIAAPHRDLILKTDEPAAMLKALLAYIPVRMNKSEWVLKMEKRHNKSVDLP